MPPITPCGMAVEWLRSCHIGAWRFYAGRLDVVTRGRYYFLPPGTPHLPFPHDFGSAVWRNGDVEPEIRPGEIANYKRQWSNGKLGTEIPPATPIGTAGEFSGQLAWPFAEPARTSQCGVDSRCWGNAGFALIGRDAICALNECSLQLAMAQCLYLNYYPDPGRLQAFFSEWIGPGTTTTFFPVAGIFPSMTLAVHPKITVIVVAGTDNADQLATQAMSAKFGPTPLGLYASNPTWQACSTQIITRMQALGVNIDRPMLLVGHSYGAAAATLTAIRLKAEDYKRDICLMAFGCPKPGNYQAVNALSQIDHIYIQTDGDFVPMLPPSEIEMLPFGVIIGPILAALWARWKAPELRWMLRADGQADWQGPPLFDGQVLLPILLSVLSGGDVPIFTQHLIPEYVRRLKLNCPDPCWPMTRRLMEILFGQNLIVWQSPKIPPANVRLESPLQRANAALRLHGTVPAALGALELEGAFPAIAAATLKLESEAPLPAATLKLESEALPAATLKLESNALPAAMLKLESEAPLPAATLKLESVANAIGTAATLKLESEALPAATLKLESPPIAAPGVDCAHALALAVGQSFSWQTSTTQAQWYRVPVPSGVQHKAKVTTAAIQVTVTVTEGASCPGTMWAVISSVTPCANRTPGSALNWYLNVGATLGGSFAYTVQVAVGACP